MSVIPILVVDEKPESGAVTAKILADNGFSVQARHDGASALDLLAKTHFKLVIAGEQTPRKSGVDILETVTTHHPGTSVILTTGSGSVSNAVKAMQLGASDYLLKPFSRETLLLSVQRALVTTKSENPKTAKTKTGSPGRHSRKKAIVTQHAGMQTLLKMAQNVANSTATILILGESGTGKELLASYIHHNSPRKHEPFIAINCAALPETLAESELFGHEKGAFTGAIRRKIGKFEQASGGTILLDEISELAHPLQAKLLRVLQEQEVDRIGGCRPIAIDTRVIAISNVDLKKAVHKGRFRQDLFYRLNVIPLTLPPLRDRGDDIALLAQHFVEKFSRLNLRPEPALTREALMALKRHPWEGNVRELENTMERAVLISSGEEIDPDQLILDETQTGNTTGLAIRAGVSVREMEKSLVYETLKEVNDNRTHAAKMLGISIRTLRNKLREYQSEGNVVCQAS